MRPLTPCAPSTNSPEMPRESWATISWTMTCQFLPISGRRLQLLTKPVIDTLFLSPLAFPENPYHRLVKDYKLVRDAVNDPVADARLAASVFLDQWESFGRMAASGRSEILSFYRFCFEDVMRT